MTLFVINKLIESQIFVIMKQSTASRTKSQKNVSAARTQHKSGSRPSTTSTQNGNRSNSSGTHGSAGTPRKHEDTDTVRNSNSNQSQGNGKSASRGSSNHQHAFKGESHLEKFFLDQLKDIYYAENKITQALPKMQEAATTNELKEAFEDHLHQTQRHVKRLEKAFESIGQKAEGKKCEAIEGIAREVDNIIEETEEGTLTRDAALIIAAQKVEHYEIATYGGLLQLAITMQLHDAADLLDKTLIEEEDTDARLTEIAENDINLQAEHEGSEAWDETQAENGQHEEDNEEEDVDEESPTIH